MFIASQKRKENIAEYVLYMWQVEDTIRACALDIDKIKEVVIDRFTLTDEQRHQMAEWYESLIDMMKREGKESAGHLQIVKNTIASIADLHHTLLNDPKFPEYGAEFYKTLPFIVELRAKAGDNAVGEIETCFTALYGVLMLRIQGKEVSPQTSAAISHISHFLAVLAHYYNLNDEDKLFKEEE